MNIDGKSRTFDCGVDVNGPAAPEGAAGYPRFRLSKIDALLDFPRGRREISAYKKFIHHNKLHA